MIQFPIRENCDTRRMDVGGMFFDEMELLIGVDDRDVVQDDVDVFQEDVKVVQDDVDDVQDVVDVFEQGVDQVTEPESCDSDPSHVTKHNKRKLKNRESAQLSRNRKICKQQKLQTTLEENASRINELEIKVNEQATRIRELERREASLRIGDVCKK